MVREHAVALDAQTKISASAAITRAPKP